jgi:lysozyme
MKMQARNSSNAIGIDVSHYQGDIDWPTVAASGISFAFLKATEGTTYVDDYFAANVAGARAAGIKVGAYHFLRAETLEEAVQEAQHYLDTVDGVGELDLPPVLDVEVVTDAVNMSAICRAWTDRVREVTGQQPIIYTYPYFADQYLDASLSDIRLWLANYDVNQPNDRAGWTHWTFLQYTDKGQVPGIRGNVDMNEYEGSVEDLNGYQMSPEDANKVISLLSGAYGATTDDEAKEEFHRLANELRKASGQPEE